MKIIKSNNQLLIGASDEDRNEIKNKLTFDNPRYISAKKYSRYGYTTLPPYLEYFKEVTYEGVQALEVPIGLNINSILECREIETEDLRVDKEIEYPPFVLELREDQELAKQEYLKGLKEEYPKYTIQLPTGKGKTILALNLAHTLKQKTLVLVHKNDLVVGWNKDIKLCFDDKIKSGLIKAQSKVVGEHITIATVQTLSRMSEEELSTFINEFGLVIQDEMHRIGLNMFNIIGAFNSKYKLGLSATPKRTDGLDFTFDLFLGGICYKHKVTAEDKDISSVKVYRNNTKVKYTPIVVEGKILNLHDYTEEDLPRNHTVVENMPYDRRPQIPYADIDNLVVLDRKYKIQVCKDVLRHFKRGHSSILMFQYKEQVRAYYDYLKRYVPEDTLMLYYGDSKEDSQTLMSKAESKECLITLATLAKATEGTNVKSWEVMFLISSVNNEKNVEQVTGRIRRVKEGKISPVIVYDYRCPDVYTFRSHGATRDRVYTRLLYQLDGDVPTSTNKFSRGFKSRWK